MDNQFTIVGALGTVFLHATLLGGIGVASHFFSSEAEADNKLEDMVMIEAQIAYKKQDAPKQPQKKFKKKRKKKVEGISRDAEKKVEPEKQIKKDDTPDWEKFKRPDEEEDDDEDNDDLPDGKAPPKAGGAWDGKEYGWADENKGHPYMQEIARQVRFDVPTLEKGKGFAIACVRLMPDGTISETKLRKKSGITNIDRAAEEAMRTLETSRKDPNVVEPVPAPLMDITNKWLCFKLGL